MAEVAEEKKPKVYSDDPFTNKSLTLLHGPLDDVEEPAAAEITTDAPKEGEEVKATAAEPVDVNKIIAEKSGGKFNTLEELLNAPKETTTVEPKFANDESKRIYELLLEGKNDDVLTYLSEQKKDYKTLSDVDVLKNGLQKEKPWLSLDDVNELVADQYGVGEKITEDDKVDLSPRELKEKEARIAKNERSLKRDASAYRVKLDSGKTEIKLPEIKAKEAQLPADYDQYQAEAKALNNWMTQLDEGVKATPESIDYSFTIEVPDGQSKVSYSTPFKIDGDNKKALDNYVKNFIPVQGTEAVYVKDGKVDVDRVRNEAIDHLFGRQMYGILLKESVAKAKEGVVTGIKNLNLGEGNGIIPAVPLTNEEWLIKNAMHT